MKFRKFLRENETFIFIPISIILLSMIQMTTEGKWEITFIIGISLLVFLEVIKHFVNSTNSEVKERWMKKKWKKQ